MKVTCVIVLKQIRHNSELIANQFIQAVADGPLRSVKCYPGMYVNGYKFHTERYGSSRSTINSGVCIKGSNYSVDESDYYGRLQEIIELEYPGWPIKRTVLFNCDWFDPTPNVGTKVHKQYKLVEINHKRRFNKFEPFVLAMQAAQVYYVPYPSLKRDKSDWWAVCKIKARSVVEMPESSTQALNLNIEPFQDDEVDHSAFEIDEIDENLERIILSNQNPDFIDLDDEEVEVDEEPEFETETDEQDDDDIDTDNDFIQ